MSDAGFPERPKGSPGGIENAASLLVNAAQAVETGSGGLKRTASGLSGVAWSGDAEARFTGAAGALAGVARTAEETLRDAARATKTYARALEVAQREIDAARADYETAKVAEANAITGISNLSRLQAAADPSDMSAFDGDINAAQADLSAAVSQVAAALKRAQRARGDFDDAQRTAIAAMSGQDPGNPFNLGAPASGVSGGAVPFGLAGGTGGWGAFGGGFGVPQGGLGNYTGFVPFDNLEALDGLAHSAWLDQHGQTEVSDLTVGIVTVVTLGGGAIVGGAARGGSALLGRFGAAGRTQAERLAAGARGIASNPESRASMIEKFGDLADTAGVPQAGNLSKVAAQLSQPSVRWAWRYQLHRTAGWFEQKAAILRATAEMSRGVRRGLPPEAVEAMRRAAGVP